MQKTIFLTHTDITTDDVLAFINEAGNDAFVARDVTRLMLDSQEPGKAQVAYIRNRLGELVDLGELSSFKKGKATVYVASTPGISQAEIDGLLDEKPQVKPMPTTKKKPAAKGKKATTAPASKAKPAPSRNGSTPRHGLKKHPEGRFEFKFKVSDDGKTKDGLDFKATYFKCPRTGQAVTGKSLAYKDGVAKFPNAFVRKNPPAYPPRGATEWYVWTTNSMRLKQAPKPDASKAKAKATPTKATPEATASTSVKPAVSSMSQTAIREELKKAGITVATAASKKHLALALVNHRTAKMQQGLNAS